MFETELEPEQGAPVLPVRNVYSVGILLATDRDWWVHQVWRKTRKAILLLRWKERILHEEQVWREQEQI